MLTRCGVFQYMEPDGSVRRELRLPEDVFSPTALESFNSVPITDEHPPEMLNSSNWKTYTIGWLKGRPAADGDHVRGDAKFYDENTVEKMRRSGQTQVSLGYLCDLIEEPGTHPKYGEYDAIQKNLVGNHCAIVETARAGNTARVRLDAAERMPERKDEWSDAAREASAEARKNAAGKAGEDANRATVQATTSGKGHDKAAALHRAAAAAARAAGDNKGAKEHEAQAKDHERQAQKPGDKRAAEEFGRMRAAYEHNKAAAEFASKRRTSELAKYVTKKDAGILGLDSYLIGTVLASSKSCAMVSDMDRTDAEDETKPMGGKPASKDPDPKDEANRSAKGENDAKPKDKAGDEKIGSEAEKPHDDEAGGEGTDPEDPDDDDADDTDDPDDDGDEADQVHDDAYTASYDEDGKLTDEARHKMSTSNFAVPDREGLPIHDPEHVRAAMSRFGQFEFKDPEEKHAAFNRIGKRAKQFGVSSEGFEKAHRQTLDRQDSKMNKIHEANKRADQAEAALAKTQGELASLKKDVETLTVQLTKARTDAADGYNKAVAAKVALLAEAGKTGAKVDASMKDIDIKRATVKHVDSIDVPADKPEAYVDAMYDGAIRRHAADTQATAAGAQALGQARAVVVETREVAKKDSATDDEAAVAAAVRARNATAWDNWAPKHTRQENK